MSLRARRCRTLAGALIGSGRPALAVAVPVAAAIIAGDHLAYLSGTAVIGWWRRRRPGRATDRHAIRQGRAAGWLTAAMPSLAGAAQLPYRSFAPRLLAMRLAWLAGLLAAGALAAHSLAAIGRVAGIATLAVATAFFAAHWLDPIQTGIAAAALGLAAAGLTLALAVAGQPFTALAAGASLGTAGAAIRRAGPPRQPPAAVHASDARAPRQGR